MKGFTAIAKVANEIDEKQKQREEEFKRRAEDFGPPILYLRLPNDGDTAKVRFLEQGDDVFGYYYHDFSSINGQTGWKTKIACLDQDGEDVPCPGCKEDLKRGFEGLVNVIWRNAPVYKIEDNRKVKDSDGEYVVIGHEDQVAVWRGGINLFNKVLKRKDHAFKGLTTRDFEVVREGSGLKTTYSVEPVDIDGGPSPLSESDKQLAADKYDLKSVARFVDEHKFDEIIGSKLEGDARVNEEVDDVKDFLNQTPYGEDN